MTAVARDHLVVVQDHEPVDDPGLVICAKTLRVGLKDVDVSISDEELAQVSGYEPRFPSAEGLINSVGLFDAIARWDGHEGPRARVSVGPGAVGVAKRDLARRERTAEREVSGREKVVEQLAGYLVREGELPPPPQPRREITGWSRKSRANMVRALCELDYREMMASRDTPAMVTLTYPGAWEVVAPDGQTAKKHLDEFCLRYRRAWGTDLVAVWKLEFQRRGAPHFHLMMVPPHGVSRARSDAIGFGLAFRPWLSAVWADIVNHPDPAEYFKHLQAGTGVDFKEGARATDPKRAAVYFTKHGSFAAKEYQHIVPELWRTPGCGPGRFWGYRRLERVVAQVEVSLADAAVIARTIRRWARAQQTTREVQAPRMPGGRPVAATWEVVGLAGAQLLGSRGRVRHRRVRRRVDRLHTGAGWVSVNDGASFAAQLARYLAQLRARAAAVVHGLVAERVAYA